jgi:hypothetical protein
MAKVQKMLVSLNLSGNELINAVLGTEAGTKNGAVWFDLASGRVAIKDGNGTTQYLTPKSYVDAEVAGEAATRASEITRVEGLVSTEEAARQSGDANLQSQINTLIANNQTYAAGVAAAFTQDRTRLTAIESKNTEQDSRLTAVEGSVASESARALSAEASLASDIAAVAADVAALDGNYATDAEVASAVAAEASARSTAVSSEASARQAADATLQSNVNAVASDLSDEAAARTSADSALAQDLADETAAREAADTALANDVANEASRATAAEADLASDISDVASDLASEETARAAADATLQSNIDAEVSARQGAVTAEATTRAAADAALQSALTTMGQNNAAYATSVTAAFTEDRTRLANIESLNGTQNGRLDNIEANYATKTYVDQAIQGLDITESVKAAAQTVSSTSGLTVDGVTLTAGDRVLVLEGANQGIWTVASGAWTLVTGPDAGTFVFVEGGSTFGSNGYVLAANSQWVQFSGAGQVVAGSGLSKSGNTLSVEVGNGLKVENDAVQLDGPVSIANGGTGATNATDARAALGAVTKYSETIGDGTEDTFVISHNFGTSDVTVSVRDAATGEVVMVSVSVTNNNAVTVEFASAPASDEFRVTVIG